MTDEGATVRRSESIKHLAAALCAAQADGDRFAESRIVAELFPPGRYRSNQNDGRSPIWRFYLKVVFGASDCWYWVGSRNRLGYGQCNGLRAHRVSWELHRGPIPTGLDVLHRCDVRCCVNPDHLFLGTHSDNMRDMVAKGRRVAADVRGEKNPMRKLTTKQVAEMRRLRRDTGMSYRAIAVRFGVQTMTAHRAINGTNWSHIEGDDQ